MHENFVHASTNHWKLNLIIKKRRKLKVLRIYTDKVNLFTWKNVDLFETCPFCKTRMTYRLRQLFKYGELKSETIKIGRSEQVNRFRKAFKSRELFLQKALSYTFGRVLNKSLLLKAWPFRPRHYRSSKQPLSCIPSLYQLHGPNSSKSFHMFLKTLQ